MPDEYTGDKSLLSKHFNDMRTKPHGNFQARYKIIDIKTPEQLRQNILNSDVCVLTEPKEAKALTGRVRTKNYIEKVNDNNAIAITKSELTDTTSVVWFDIENGIDDTQTFKNIEEAVKWVEKTYLIKISGGRYSTSGKEGRYHLWAMLDTPISMDTLKRYIFERTPDKKRILVQKAPDSRPQTRIRCPYIDLDVYTTARLIYGMKSHKWLYENDVITKRTNLNFRKKPLPVENDFTESDLDNAKETHREALGLSKEQYNFFDNNAIIYKDDTIFTGDTGEPIKASDAVVGGRYSFIQNQKSPSLACYADGLFYEHREQRKYKLSDENLFFYDNYISEIDVVDFDSMKSGIISAVTGSGKTTVFSKRPRTLIAVPRRKQATVEAGTSKKDMLKLLEDGCIIITYDKLIGHLRADQYFLNDLYHADIRLVIDEAHQITSQDKYEPLLGLDAIYMSGTLFDHFRPDLERYTFISRSDTQPIQLCDKFPADVSENCLIFIEDKSIESEVNHKKINADTKKRKKLKKGMNIATSAIREGISLYVKEGEDWSVVVDMRKCGSWSFSDAVQALARVRGKDVKKYLILPKNYRIGENNTIENMKEHHQVDLEGYIKSIKKLKVTATTISKGMGLGRRFEKNVFGTNDYEDSSYFSIVKHLDEKNSRKLPKNYTYVEYGGEYMPDPYYKPKEDKEPVYKNFDTFRFGEPKYVKYTGSDKEIEHWDMMFANKKIGLPVLERVLKQCGGDLSEFAHKYPAKSRISKREAYNILRKLFECEFTDSSGGVYKKWSDAIEKAEILSYSPYKLEDV